MKAGQGTYRRCCLVTFVLGALLAFGAQGASAATFVKGDVFVTIGAGKINQYSSTGSLKGTLDTTTNAIAPPGNETGMCFDPQGRLYSTDFDAYEMSRFSNTGALINRPFGPSTNDFPPQSCVVDEAGQYVYAGLNEGDNSLLKMDTNGTLVRTSFVDLDQYGISGIDLGSDGCTLYYTSEGAFVLRYDVCGDAQVLDFASSLPGPCYQLQVRTNGELLVACDASIVRLNSSGSIIQTYNPGSEADFFAIALDPDGTSFWAAGYGSGHVYKVNISSGSTSTNYIAPLSGVDVGVGGLAVYGDAAAPDPGYARPKGATPLRASLVPAFKTCTSPNRTHGGTGAIAKPSCNPPVQQSNFLTIGSPDANGAPSNAIGSVTYNSLVGNSSTVADEADVRITTSVTDVRNKAGLADYTGQLQESATLRWTDRFNSQDFGTQPYNDTGTGQDTPLNVTIPCVTTASTSVGSACSLITTADAVLADTIKEGLRTVLQMDKVQVFDGGSDGLAATAGNTLFMDQGWFAP
jgi:hypothetical protein